MPSNSQAQLTPEERRRRIATLLATGLIHLGTALVPPTSAPDPDPKNLPKSSANQLADSGETSVTVSAG
jgi:hypothetical protein